MTSTLQNTSITPEIQPNTIAAVILVDTTSAAQASEKFTKSTVKQLVDTLASNVKKAGVKNIFLTKRLGEYPALKGLEKSGSDAKAMKEALNQLKEKYQGVLFIPASMADLPPKALKELIRQKEGAFFAGSSLPAFVTKPFSSAQRPESVQKLLGTLGIYPAEPSFETEKNLSKSSVI